MQLRGYTNRQLLMALMPAFVGILATVAGMVFIWALHYRQAVDMANVVAQEAANETIAVVDGAILESAEALGSLVATGNTNCSRLSRNAHHQALFSLSSTKELLIGNTEGPLQSCTTDEEEDVKQLSNRFELNLPNTSMYLASIHHSRGPVIIVERRILGGGRLAAVIPAKHLPTNSLPAPYSESGYIFISLLDGTRICSVNQPLAPEARAFEEMFALFGYSEIAKIRHISGTFPVAVSVSVPVSISWGLVKGTMGWISGVFVIVASAMVILFTLIGLRGFKPKDELELAIEGREFIPYYQPLLNIQTGELVGCEVLIRWKKPDGRVLSPMSFIDKAEISGMGVPMTNLLMQQVAQDLAAHCKANPDFKVGINLFDQHFMSMNIVHDIRTIFEESEVRFTQLVLEVTERRPLTDIDMAKRVIGELKRLGCRLALDDAGTGHGGLAYLQQLGFDVLKIDRMFVSGLGDTKQARFIVSTLADLAKKLDLEVVAEGVENIEQINYLKSIGVTTVQGFVFSPALPCREFLQLSELMGPSKSAPEQQAGAGRAA